MTERMQTARHESAHCVVGHAIGLRVEVVSIDEAERRGCTRYVDGLSELESAITSLAGVEQVTADGRDVIDCARSDFRRARSVADDWASGDAAFAQELLETWSAYARRVLDRERARVEALALELDRAGTLTEAQVCRVIGPPSDRRVLKEAA